MLVPKALSYGAAATLFMASLVLPRAAVASHFSLGISLRGSPVWVPSVYETRAKTIVIPALYENAERRIWREPVYEERQRSIEIPAEIVTRRVPRYDSRGRLVGYRLVEEVVRPARTIWKRERVLVRPGHYDLVVERVLVRPERTETVYEKTLITPGHWVYPTYHPAGYRDRGFRFYDEGPRDDRPRRYRVRTRD